MNNLGEKTPNIPDAITDYHQNSHHLKTSHCSMGKRP